MKIARIQITNMAKFETFAIAIPAIALIQGSNGMGKTSLMDCVRYCFGRGHDPSMIHAGAEFGEILLTFDDGSAIKTKANRTTNETKRGYKAANSTKFLISREQIDAMANAISYDPLRFMDLDDKQQIETILKIMPVNADPAEIEPAVGEAGPEAESAVSLIKPGMNAFDTIQVVHRTIYDKRRDLNVAADTQTKHAAELESALALPDAGTNWQKVVDAVGGRKTWAEDKLKNRLQTITAGFADFKEKQIAEMNEAMRKIRESYDGVIEAERDACKKVADEARAEFQPLIDLATGELATAQERLRIQQQSTGTQAAITVARAEAAAKQERSRVLTDALDRLTALKAAIAARLPIQGIDFEDGKILNKDQVPFSRWNTEKQLLFCLRLGVLAHGAAGFICLDGAERFDSVKRNALLKTAQKYSESDGLQFIIATVSDGPLVVEDGGKKG